MVLILLALSSCEVKEHNDFSEMNSQNDSSAEQQIELEAAMQQGPLDAYEALVSALQHSTRSESEAVLASLPSNLPEYLAGTYINDANQLVVQIVDQYYSCLLYTSCCCHSRDHFGINALIDQSE